MGEYLASAGDNRTGELRFGPTPEEKPQRWLPQGEALVDLPDEGETLKSLLDAATALEAGEPSRHHIRTLIRAGADVGGARPKARIFKNDRTEWIAKFPASDDVFDDPRVEAVCLSLARKAGIVVPDHEIIEIGGRAVLLVSRFDRAADGARLGYSSAATLLGQVTTGYGTDYTYADVAAKARTAGIEPCEPEIFKRLLFNCFIRNTDDHLRNHGFVRDKYGWRISPAFDLVVHRGRRLVLRAGSGIDPIPDARLAFGAWKQFHLNFKQAVQIYEEVTEALGSLPCLLEEFSVRTVDRLLLKELMGQAFNPQPLASG
jgi:serine/threonine-protein kinase HipA